MAIPNTPFLSEDSLLAWEKESTRGTAPSTGSAWRSFGRVTDFSDLGPRHAIARDPVVGAGQEPHELVFEGRSYGGTIGPFQVRDPLILGHVWGKQTAVSGDLGGGFYRHTVAPTDLGQLPSFSVGMRDIKNLAQSGVTGDESIIYLETVMPRLSLRGEAPSEDGSGGRLLAACDVLPHDHTTSGANAVTVNLGTSAPYRFSHAEIQLESEVIGRIQEWEITVDRAAQLAYYWQDVNGDAPFEAVPEGSTVDLTITRFEDGHQLGGSNRTVREILRAREQVDMVFKFVRTTDQDEFQINLTDVTMQEATATREKGKIPIRVSAPVRASTFQYVDDSSSAFFPT